MDLRRLAAALGLHRSPPPEPFVADSPLEGDGFEPSVPRETTNCHFAEHFFYSRFMVSPLRDRWFADSPVEEAVKSEPVSEWGNSLLAGKIQGIHPILALMMPICRRKGSKGQRLTSKIPYATEQGINSAVSG